MTLTFFAPETQVTPEDCFSIVDAVFADEYGQPLTMNSDWYYAFEVLLEYGEWTVTVPENITEGDYYFSIKMIADDPSQTEAFQDFTISVGDMCST
jgi:hypothetical protein